MKYLFENNDVLNAPYEGFIFDTTKECFPIKPHWHYFMEIIYMQKGTALIECDEQSYIVSPGDLILFFPKVVHSIYATTNEALTYAVIKFDLNLFASHNSYTPNLQNIFSYARHQESAPIYFPSEHLSELALDSIFIQAIHEITAKEFGYNITVHALLWTLFIEILRYWRKQGFDTDVASLSTSDLSEENSLYTITHYIDQHSHESLKVEDLAHLCHMSYSYFAKCFQQLYGQSCKHYIESVRICKATDYLRSTNFDLTYISQETGFSDCSHLIKTFKKLKGITPKQFRMQSKE